MTFANAAEKFREGENGHSQVAITEVGKEPAERLHPKSAYSRCRPIADMRGREANPGKPPFSR